VPPTPIGKWAREEREHEKAQENLLKPNFGENPQII
jgi:hypothetical protein